MLNFAQSHSVFIPCATSKVHSAKQLHRFALEFVRVLASLKNDENPKKAPQCRKPFSERDDICKRRFEEHVSVAQGAVPVFQQHTRFVHPQYKICKLNMFSVFEIRGHRYGSQAAGRVRSKGLALSFGDMEAHAKDFSLFSAAKELCGL